MPDFLRELSAGTAVPWLLGPDGSAGVCFAFSWHRSHLGAIETSSQLLTTALRCWCHCPCIYKVNPRSPVALASSGRPPPALIFVPRMDLISLSSTEALSLPT